jgi:hypothetical protein
LRTVSRSCPVTRAMSAMLTPARCRARKRRPGSDHRAGDRVALGQPGDVVAAQIRDTVRGGSPSSGPSQSQPRRSRARSSSTRCSTCAGARLVDRQAWRPGHANRPFGVPRVNHRCAHRRETPWAFAALATPTPGAGHGRPATAGHGSSNGHYGETRVPPDGKDDTSPTRTRRSSSGQQLWFSRLNQPSPTSWPSTSSRPRASPQRLHGSQGSRVAP